MCHQPGLPSGKLVLTTYALFAKGGEHGAPFVAGHPEKSIVLDYLTGKTTLMPKGGPPLPDAAISLIRRWIAEGATDDTPAVKDPIDEAHPPVYAAQPVITALAFSPDGQTLAVSGYREILLHRADGSSLTGRLVGKAQDIESLAYSPDGTILGAVGGTPARFGEVEFWNASTHKLINAVRSTYDTIFGAAFSPDGNELSFGGADNSVRVVTVPAGKELLDFGNHSDWVFATAFSMDGKDLLSASRDQAVKLTVAATGSFIDDINTHYSALSCLVRNPKPIAAFTQTGPRRFRLEFVRDMRAVMPGLALDLQVVGAGAGSTGEVLIPYAPRTGSGGAATMDAVLPADLKDGPYAVFVGPQPAPGQTETGAADTPARVFVGSLTVSGAGKTLELKPDVVVCGGADGIPRLYQVFRTEARTMMMEDHNLIRAFERQGGPITALAMSPDGLRIAVGSEAPGVNLYSTATGERIATLRGNAGTVHALAFSPDGTRIATGGFDGTVRVYSLAPVKLVASFGAAPVRPRSPAIAAQSATRLGTGG